MCFTGFLTAALTMVTSSIDTCSCYSRPSKCELIRPWLLEPHDQSNQHQPPASIPLLGSLFRLLVSSAAPLHTPGHCSQYTAELSHASAEIFHRDQRPEGGTAEDLPWPWAKAEDQPDPGSSSIHERPECPFCPGIGLKAGLRTHCWWGPERAAYCGVP